MTHQRPDIQVQAKGSKTARTWGSAFIRAEGVGAQSLEGSLFIGDFKIEEQEFKAQEEKKKKSTPSNLLLKSTNQPRSLKQRRLGRGGVGGGGLLPHLVSCGFIPKKSLKGMPLKQMPLQSKLKSVTCFTKRKQTKSPKTPQTKTNQKNPKLSWFILQSLK